MFGAPRGSFLYKSATLGGHGPYYGSFDSKSFFCSLIFVLKMDTWRAPGAPWEAHGVPFGGPRARLKPLFRENGEHEFFVVFTVFAPHYSLQGAPMLAPKMTTEAKSEHTRLEKCKTGHNSTRAHKSKLTHTHIYIYIYVYKIHVCIYIYVCVCI